MRARARGPEYGRTGTMVPSEERDSLLGGGAVPERRSITQDGRMLVLGSFSVKDNLKITSRAAPSDANFYSTLGLLGECSLPHMWLSVKDNLKRDCAQHADAGDANFYPVSSKQ